ncbi:MAG: hypothetical protein GX941_03305 [Candidatus Methanofastidiosa archaeon]|nr:hypothetical protein [Candidatus Methanofastidiosa archaeon]
MFQLGWNRLPSDIYLRNALCLWCDIEEVLKAEDKKEENTAKKFKMKNGYFEAFDYPNEYMCMHLAASFEQEIFRTAVRDFSANEPVDIFVFYPNPKVIELIKQRLNCTIINHNNDLPIEFDLVKIAKRNNKANKQNKIQKFLTWLEKEWDGREISINQIKKKFKISDSYWKKINRNEAIKKLKTQKKIKSRRKGRGKEQVIIWYIND